jgi:hypothetical protein
MQAQTEIDTAVWPQVDDLASSFDTHRTTVEVQNHPGRTLDLVDRGVVRERYDEWRQQYEKFLGLHNELSFERDQLQIQLTAVTGGQTATAPLSVLLPPVPRSVLPLPLLPPVSLSVLPLPSLPPDSPSVLPLPLLPRVPRSVLPLPLPPQVSLSVLRLSLLPLVSLSVLPLPLLPPVPLAPARRRKMGSTA